MGGRSAAVAERRRDALSRLRRSGWTVSDARTVSRSPGLVPFEGWELQKLQASDARGRRFEIYLAHGSVMANSDTGTPVEILGVCSADAVRSRMQTARAVEIAIGSCRSRTEEDRRS
jgi:hypothetical protein